MNNQRKYIYIEQKKYYILFHKWYEIYNIKNNIIDTIFILHWSNKNSFENILFINARSSVKINNIFIISIIYIILIVQII